MSIVIDIDFEIKTDTPTIDTDLNSLDKLKADLIEQNAQKNNGMSLTVTRP